MPAIQLTLTAEQLASAYGQMSARERRSFLSAVVSRPEHREAAVELLRESRASLKKKFTPAKQRELDRLLDKNARGKLNASEKARMEKIMGEYGDGLIEKARAAYILSLDEQAESIE
jgi:hypothetical protein